jgi:hypothetical protein
MEKISYCKTNNVSGALLSIDQSRAFDTISHKYMTEVFRFFGFGEQFTKVLNTIGTNRYAAIIFEDGTLSKNFNLETGRTQGDGPSPLLYNMGEQILLLKIELDPSVASVFQHQQLPNFTMDLVPDPRLGGRDLMYNSHLAVESNRSTDKADSFADDNSTATLATADSLGSLKNFVDEFAIFSGLHSNAEKTTLLQIGTVAQLPENVLALGFNVVNQVTLLGLSVDNNLSCLTSHFDAVIRKIENIIEYWERFHLTLAGRISVCKTFMLAQIGYIGSIITPTQAQFKKMQELIDNFCLGSLRTARKKLYLPPAKGGLGLINLKNYITALQCAWIKRTTEHWCDNWRFDIKKASYGNPLIVNENTFSRDTNPILFNICNSFGQFAKQFYKKERNYRKALIFKNQMFKRGRNDNGILDENFFGPARSYEELKKIAKLTYDDFVIRGRSKSLDHLCADTGINFNLNDYMRIHEALQFYVLSRRNDDPEPEQSIKFFLRTFSRGSRSFRRILEYHSNNGENLSGNNSVETFFKFIGTEIFEERLLRSCWASWNLTFFCNVQREFLYKFFNNILGLNSRVANFVAGHSAECSLCVLNGEPFPINSESFLHIFFECEYSSKYRNMAESDLFPEIRGQNEQNKKIFWLLGLVPAGNDYRLNIFMQSVVFSCNFLIWRMKLNKNCLPVSIFKADLLYMCGCLLRKSVKLREAKTNDHFFLCRQNL